MLLKDGPISFRAAGRLGRFRQFLKKISYSAEKAFKESRGEKRASVSYYNNFDYWRYFPPKKSCTT